MRRIKLKGIYDTRTLKNLGELKLSEFSFDFRPHSLNFLQQHRFLEILQESFDESYKYFLHYGNEKDFMIKHTLEGIKSSLNVEFLPPNIFLEFSDSAPASFYDQFEVPYYWHYQGDSQFKEILSSKNLKGVIISFSHLYEAHEKNFITGFFNNFMQLFTKHGASDLEIGLELDWDSNVFPSLFDYFDFDFVSLPINSKVEVCYRNVDLDKIKNLVPHFRNLSI